MEQGNKKVILSSAFLAPVQYFTKLVQYDEVWLEGMEHFLKQSYRNRCTILTANGMQNLSIPVTEGSNSRRLVRDVMISYDHPWQKLHWKALLSAYNSAPFFEYYQDSLQPFFTEKRWKFLMDYNDEIQEVVLDELGLKCKSVLTETFCPVSKVPADLDDFRYAIHPKEKWQAKDEYWNPQEYMQVFQEKFGFIPNLSIVDLLFNEGPNAAEILRKSAKKR